MIAEIALLAALSAAPDSTLTRTTLRREQQAPPASRDRWFATDKVKHFFMSALIQSSAYSLARTAQASRSNAQVAAGVTSMVFGVAKEVRDRREAKVFSLKDLVWDGAGALMAAALLNGTR